MGGDSAPAGLLIAESDGSRAGGAGRRVEGEGAGRFAADDPGGGASKWGPAPARCRLAWPAMARILIVGGGCRGRRLGGELTCVGHAVRITTRCEAGRESIEAAGAECWIGTPARLGTLRGALDGASLACWMLAGASGTPQELRALHGSRLEGFLRQMVDTSVRGFIYDASPRALEPRLLQTATQMVESLAGFNAIPTRVLTATADEDDGWIAGARRAVEELLRGGRSELAQLSSK